METMNKRFAALTALEDLCGSVLNAEVCALTWGTAPNSSPNTGNMLLEAHGALSMARSIFCGYIDALAVELCPETRATASRAQLMPSKEHRDIIAAEGRKVHDEIRNITAASLRAQGIEKEEDE